MNRLILNMVALVAIVLGGLGLFMFGIDNIVNPSHPTYEKSVGFAAGAANSSGDSSSNGDQAGSAGSSTSGEGKDYNHETSFVELKKLQVKADVGKVKIEWIADGQNRVEWNGKAPQSVIDTISQAEIDHNGTLSLDFSVNRKWKDTPLLDLGGQNYEHNVIIHAPAGFVLEQLDSRVAAGDLSIDGLQVKQLKAVNNLGQIVVKNVQGEFAELHSDAGDIQAVKLDARLDVSSALGKVKLIDTKQDVEASVTTGDLVVEQETPHSVDAKVTLGNIVVKAANGFDGRVTAHSTLGNVSLPDMDGGGALRIKVRTETGNVTVVQK
ncbi:DUF4097 family beta strand repeat-containing protein [Paenibacillus sp. 1001270B_150601_E10]|uniref:DUF4097 family beta strand repeat-containing protein n=1 Tax=Paenibacillus sp. 1001270B_150601_E10 TaxID=2787079 RepID=UPI00189D8D1A|nr:DUF4097 family beta strand repeat-containing protein [Paenibacillus sp. 1001270B_150601_E10]